MNMMLSEIAACVQGKLIGEDTAISAVSIDTRAIKPGQLYVAIKGHNFDGNEFVVEAEQSGASAAIVHQGITATIPYVIVDDTRLALAELAGAWRKKASVSVVGITGSNGKTTVKEMVAAILSASDPTHGNTLFTQGNLNNDIGVPLTLLRLNEQHRHAVIEMGANHPGEIEYTSQYAQADVAIITNVGPAHIEGFGSIDGIAKAKGEIIETLKQDGVAVLNRDDAYFDYWKSLAGTRKVISFGIDELAGVTTHSVKTEIIDHAFATTFDLVTAKGEVTVKLRLAGRHNVVNALAAAAACLALGTDLQQIKQGLESVNPVTGRLQPLVSRLGNIVIDDTYNANSASLKAGLDVLANCDGKRWLVLGAFGEQGSESPKIHEQMGELIKSCGVVRLLAVGSDARNTVKVFGEGATFFDSQNDLIEVLKQELKGDEAILIKGSRAQRMENVAAALVENFRI
ncbi:MAG: UDP-N-acetylmuramoyl-tripeptide--D-alanyl-D-alanine ligase [Methylobacter sp.]|uniref:UDP-N-acetylmuramoyl-tripeptide--D-alanyl-D- alanine ligase n=1 Tax=Methylobacter sp. TaxID=2051955 RepID=UPI002730A6CD|nr:UDP-N-acetylmuramoyl-tripeptide--D-alanyl-D-alanine ligase [Methylobacter sp.]MDP1667227.1 UDP-N-acetylmuramoyl-tripeptide--D-alanyl-D-alanine ligase [Methylobacter sp.]MDP1969879.1 UDP-N-acetylmuramoyl-tripeptide--D-alanyl-D-alanine ligase [Methylobacter sp.]